MGAGGGVGGKALTREYNKRPPTCITFMGRSVSFDSCSRICLVGLGELSNAAFNISNCLPFMAVFAVVGF